MIASGWMIADEHTKALSIAIAAIGLCALALTQRGALLGLLLVAALNGIPFISTSQPVISKLTVADFSIIALFLTAVLWLLLDNGTYRPTGIGQAISRAAVVLLLWWCFTVVRSVTAQRVPALHAISFGRDFLYFALLLLVLPRVRLERRDISALICTLTVAVCIFATGQIATATGLGQPGTLIHFEYTVQQTDLTRVYARMTDLVTAGLAVSLAAILLTRQRRVRIIAIPVGTLLLLSTIVQLTRARWIGLVVGFFLVSLWFTVHNQAGISAALRRRLTIVVGVVGILGIAALIAAPGALPGGTIVHRALSIVSGIESNTGTIAVRETATKTTTTYLTGEWPLGLGFIPPSSHYFAGLPEGSIRDSDLGVLNAVVTMGIVGAVLIYFPVIATLINCLRRLSMQRHRRYAWLRYGGAIWIVATLASSITLATLFSVGGLALTAVFLTFLAHPSVAGEPLPRTTVRLGQFPPAIVTAERGVGLGRPRARAETASR
jgi:hypothetical protein